MIKCLFWGVWLFVFISGFPGSSVGKESTCNAGDPSSIPGSGRSPGEGNGNPLQYSWASLVAQTLKRLLAMLETWVWSLGWEDPLEKEMATHSSHGRRSLVGYSPRGHKQLDTTERLHFAFIMRIIYQEGGKNAVYKIPIAPWYCGIIGFWLGVRPGYEYWLGHFC